MSYYFAVWEGATPLSNAHAASEFDRLLAARDGYPPTAVVTSLVEALRAMYPDQPGLDPASTPWSRPPLQANVDGPLAYLPVRPEVAEQMRPLIQQTAEECAMVAFDPQLGELIPSATAVPRIADFDLPAPGDLPVHLTAVIGEALGAGVGLAGILEEVETTYYVQWMAQNGALTIEAQSDHLLPPEHRLPGDVRDQMTGIGFIESDPNWRLHWDDGFQNLDQAGRILGHVLSSVRRMPVGTAMALQTFPV